MTSGLPDFRSIRGTALQFAADTDSQLFFHTTQREAYLQALGIDRWAALLADQGNIREVMAFPKTSSGSGLMLDAPSVPEASQFEELGLRFVGSPEKRG